jgi:hypothetical protein
MYNNYMSGVYIRKLKICGCCEDEIYELLQNIETNKKNAPHPGFTQLIDGVPYSDLDDKAKYLIDNCIDFLAWKDDPLTCPQNSGKYITLWSFIYSYLGIDKDSGYDYIIMCYMDTYGIIGHGCAIRCSWLEHGMGRKSSDYMEKHLEFRKWHENFPYDETETETETETEN